jgi:hypothetical protein
MNAELMKVSQDHVVKDLSQKLAGDVSAASARVTSLVKTDLERAFIVMQGMVALASVATYLLKKHYKDKMSPEVAFKVTKGFLAVCEDGLVGSVAKAREPFGDDTVVTGLLDRLMKRGA